MMMSGLSASIAIPIVLPFQVGNPVNIVSAQNFEATAMQPCQ